MTKEQINIGKDLLKLIERTENALDSLNQWIDSSTEKSIGGTLDNDYNYNLYICENRDGSGHPFDLARYVGNTKLLAIIHEELSKQLQEYKKQLEEL